MKKFAHMMLLFGLVSLLGMTNVSLANQTPNANLNPNSNLNQSPSLNQSPNQGLDISQTGTQASQQHTSNPPSKINFGPLFVQLSDAMGALKAGNTAGTLVHLNKLDEDLSAMTATMTVDSTEIQAVQKALQTAINEPNEQNLSAFSSALYALEKSQNPVDYSDKRRVFAKKVMPVFDEMVLALEQMKADDAASIDKARQAYNRFNTIWVANERVVRNTSKGHYGKIETAMALIRVSIESTPANPTQALAQAQILKTELDSFNQGEISQAVVVTGVSLNDGIALLEQGLAAFEQGDKATGEAKLGEFIMLWTSIEGEVSTRNPSLYGRIESQIPVIMASGTDPKQQAVLAGLIDELNAINPSAQYSAVDSMLILLREGLEALLIVVALLSALKVANQPKGKKYIYAGVGAGLIASVAGAVALQQLFPAMTSGASREMLEGVIGIVAVVMMIGIGAWLHSKSSVQSWNAFIKRHMGQALSTGSFVGLFGLSFLSVFREGAETILFYVGILPNISMSNFLLGIGMALAILAAVAWVMLKTSTKLPIPKLFMLLTWLIYFLGFKILGVSVSALQLTNHLPRTVLPSVPAIEWAGFYPTIQTITAQLLYIVVIVVLTVVLKSLPKQSDKPTA